MYLYICMAFAIIVPYLICSINPAIIAAKIKSGKDIREMGSGNPGLTNVLRTMGKGAAAVVLLCDVLKGVVSILLVCGFYHLFWEQMTNPFAVDFLLPGIAAERFYSLVLWLGSLSAVLGHCYPLYYKFKGGKAVLVTVATGLVINWEAALIALLVFIIIVLLSKYVSLGSVIAAALYPVCVGLTEHNVRQSEHSYSYMGAIFSAIIAALLIFKHRGNIKRLITGNEKKLGKKWS
ncbi:MAG: glycerol-3-phosphate 1-O-acyltransferase PlsY [Oscillospiraceae bacterium]|nr:glycerol-3-phosphate 1-O-acyltransferase PlsY [Oscillospiraceae bacterium]